MATDTTSLDARLRERGAAEFKQRVERAIKALREALPATELDGDRIAIPSSHRLQLRFRNAGGELQPNHYGFELTVGAAQQILEAVLLGAGTERAGQRAVEAFVAKVDGMAGQVRELQLVAGLEHEEVSHG